jgi:beta-phosphoglucomutase-like phosphatase (HAD superfamily)
MRALDQNMRGLNAGITVIYVNSTAERHLHDAQQMIISRARDIDQKMAQLTTVPITELEDLIL